MEWLYNPLRSIAIGSRELRCWLGTRLLDLEVVFICGDRDWMRSIVVFRGEVSRFLGLLARFLKIHTRISYLEPTGHCLIICGITIFGFRVSFFAFRLVQFSQW